MKKVSDHEYELLQETTRNRKRVYQVNGGYHYLIMGLALVSICTGFFLVILSISGIIRPLFFSGLGSMIGSVAIMLGGFVLYEEVAGSKGRGRLLHDALNRIIKDHN